VTEGRRPGGRAPAFPWLDHLRRDRRGLPVPWINAWGAESVEATDVRPDPVVGGALAAFHLDHGDVPDFTRQAPQRQRQAMIEGLCQVCGKPVPWSRRNLVVADLAVDWVWSPERRREVPTMTEPWLCDRCCAIAVDWCPALIRRRRGDVMRVVPVRSPREVLLMVSTGRVDGFDGAGTEVRMWGKVQLLGLDIVRTAPADPAALVPCPGL
jgi:hypothetical protein